MRPRAWGSSRSPGPCSCSPVRRGNLYEGAASDEPLAVAGYRSDLATIATDSVLKEFDIASGAQRATYLKHFWTDRDRIELRGAGERLREHYRRLFYARKNFQLTSLNRHYDIVERYRSGSRDFDDRGVIYIRHGEPGTRPPTRARLSPTSRGYSRPRATCSSILVARETCRPSGHSLFVPRLQPSDRPARRRPQRSVANS